MITGLVAALLLIHGHGQPRRDEDHPSDSCPDSQLVALIVWHDQRDEATRKNDMSELPDIEAMLRDLEEKQRCIQELQGNAAAQRYMGASDDGADRTSYRRLHSKYQ